MWSPGARPRTGGFCRNCRLAHGEHLNRYEQQDDPDDDQHQATAPAVRPPAAQTHLGDEAEDEDDDTDDDEDPTYRGKHGDHIPFPRGRRIIPDRRSPKKTPFGPTRCFDLEYSGKDSQRPQQTYRAEQGPARPWTPPGKRHEN